MKLVTVGGSGFLGLHVARAMARAGHEQVVLTRQPARARSFRLVPRVTVSKADVYDTEALARAFDGADAVMSMAGILNESGRDGSGFERVHVTLVDGLIEACRAAGVDRVLHVSALGAGAGESHYQRTKGEAEQHLRDSGLATTLFRPSVVFGRGDSFFTRFASLLRLAPVLPLACPNSKLQPVWAQDVAAAMVAALERPDAVGAAWELGGPEVYTLKELVEWTARTLGLRRAVVGLPDGISRLQAAVMDFVPGKPFSTDNYRSLQVDNVTRDNALPRLGIRPASIDAIVPDYLVESSRQKRLRKARGEHGA
ncbi:MAG: complex I NDUFA9 subunit family protein [Xanthomonadales bacterium]|jgi:NADH dehydrogenase|nr:complex I NDUFA9 subunit family protein [Xanthomonadales bacterium]